MQCAMNGTTITFRDVLQREFGSKRSRNANYSLRAFARDLQMPPSKLSEVLRGFSGLSAKSANKIAKKLQLSVTETKWFVLSVEAHHNRSKRERARFREELIKQSEGGNFSEIDLEKFKVISDWHHFAIMELTGAADFSSDPEKIARRLGLSIDEVRSAIARLIALDLLKYDQEGRLQQTLEDLRTTSDIPSREIRRHHSQILGLAEKALENVSMDQRDFSSMMLLISAEQMEEARSLIKEFRRNFDRIMKARSDEKNRLYSLSIQFIPLEKLDKKEN